MRAGSIRNCSRERPLNFRPNYCAIRLSPWTTRPASRAHSQPFASAVLSVKREPAKINGRKEKSMPTVAQKILLTAEEFFLLPDPGDGSQQELVRGEIVTMPPPGGMHGVSCNKIGRRIGNF